MNAWGVRMGRFKVYVTSRTFGLVVPDGIRLLRDLAEVERNPYGRPMGEGELIAALKDVDGVILGMDRLTRKVIYEADRLRVVGRHGVGFENIDLKAASERGVIVTYTPHANADAVADHTLALVLSLLRKIPEANASMKAGRWEGGRFIGLELSSKTLGVIGLGEIGRRVAKRARGFDMKVIYYDLFRKVDLEKELGLTYTPLNLLLSEADVVSIHIPSTAETRGMIGGRELSLMKKGAFLINTARGSIVDEDALIRALKEGRIAGAALDVFDKEPPDPDSPLLKLDNVILTPHIAGYTIEAIRRMDLAVASDVVKVLKGEKPMNIANPEALQPHAKRFLKEEASS